MFGIGMPEMVVIIVVALVVLGPKRLPEVARALGKGLAEFRKVTGDVNREIEAARNLIEAEARGHEETKRRAEREAREKEAAASSAAVGGAEVARGDEKAEASGAAPAAAIASGDAVASDQAHAEEAAPPPADSSVKA